MEEVGFRSLGYKSEGVLIESLLWVCLRLFLMAERIGMLLTDYRSGLSRIFIVINFMENKSGFKNSQIW